MCGIVSLASAQPPKFQKANYARWMVANNNWGIMSTTSTMSDIAGTPFGNPVSFADIGTGTPVFCVTPLDQSIVDLQTDSRMSLTVSQAETGDDSCKATGGGDPENPPCSRLVISGTFANVTATEYSDAVSALNTTHPVMSGWGCFGGNTGPEGHGFFVAKLQVSQVWMINMYGGASVLSPDDYFSASSGVKKSA